MLNLWEPQSGAIASATCSKLKRYNHQGHKGRRGKLLKLKTFLRLRVLGECGFPLRHHETDPLLTIPVHYQQLGSLRPREARF